MLDSRKGETVLPPSSELEFSFTTEVGAKKLGFTFTEGLTSQNLNMGLTEQGRYRPSSHHKALTETWRILWNR